MSLIGAFLIAGSLPAQTLAEDVYVATSIRHLELVDGKLPGDDPHLVAWRRTVPPVRVQLDGAGEAYAEPYAKPGAGRAAGRPSRDQKIAIRAPGDRDIRGTLYWPVRDGVTTAIKFRIDRAAAGPDQMRAFQEIKSSYYARRLEVGGPGAAWFRHQWLEARRALEDVGGEANRLPPDVRRRSESSDVARSFELLSGEQAVHENLQLDRQLRVTGEGPAEIDVQSLTGITVREFDWKRLVQELRPAKDRLARSIPADQHAVFFPSFAALVNSLDRFDQLGDTTLHVLEARSEDHQLRRRYERQLGLSMGAAARLLGPRLIGSVAITGGDPYFRTGTDVAALLEPAPNVDAAALEQALAAQIAAAAQSEPGVETTTGELAGVRYTSRRSPDRRVSSYLARLGEIVVVTNSPAQLRRLIDVTQGRTASLDSLDEFAFFRDRYRLGADDETAFVMISDATIRRWCGPVWRIGASRRIRAAAILADLQARHMDSLVARASAESSDGQLPTLAKDGIAGELVWRGTTIASSTYGSLEFQTPIGELDVSHVTDDEARMYGQWRDQYQAYWRNVFDPIAVRIGTGQRRLNFDLTVMPLIDRTEYATTRTLAGRSSISADAGDRHPGAILHAILSIDRNSKSWLLDGAGLLFGPAGSAGDIRKWLGPTVSVYVDDDPVWKKIAQATELQLTDQDAMSEARFPVALRIDITDQEALKAARLHMRNFIESSLNIKGDWKTRSHRRQEYTVFMPAPGTEPPFVSKHLQVFTYFAGDQWLMSLNEPLLKRAIDRQLDRAAAPEQRNAPAAADAADSRVAPAGASWLGKHVALELNGQAAAALRGVLAMNYGREAQFASWRNLPILTEWKRRYPQEDPVKLHERYWHVRLKCPGGGEYRWNEQLQTMESTIFGHPDEPRNDRVPPPLLENLERLGAGLTFESDGIRARGVWEMSR